MAFGSESPPPQQIHPVRALQDGGNPSGAGSSSERRLLGQDRPEGRVLYSGSGTAPPEIPGIQGQLHRFCCMHFGLSSAPRVLTKLLRPVAAWLRSRGVRMIVYLDDILLMAVTPDRLREHVAMTVNLLRDLGFIVNQDKSVLDPRDQLELLGFVVNPQAMTLVLPREKVRKIRDECASLAAADVVSVRQLARLLGRLSASIQAVFPAPLHYRFLQRDKIAALERSQSYEAECRLSPEAKEELEWWCSHLHAWNGRALVESTPDLVIATDASLTGWGAVCDGVSTGGCWSLAESRFLHINALELLAGSFAVKAFAGNRINIRVLLRMDNVSAMAYVNRLGGTRSRVLSSMAVNLWPTSVLIL